VWAKRSSFSKPPERLDSHGALADMLVPVELGAALGLGVVHVPDAHRIEPYRCRDLLHRLRIAFGADQVVAGHVGVAGVQANAPPAQWP